MPAITRFCRFLPQVSLCIWMGLSVSCGQMRVSPLRSGGGESEGELKVERTEGVALPVFSLQQSNDCSLDEKSRTLKVNLASQEGSARVEIVVVGFRSQAGDYQCVQGSGNARRREEIGTPFDSCMVRATIPGALSASRNDVHATCRTSVKDPLVTYHGSCRIQIFSWEERIQGAFSCTKLPRMMVSGSPASDGDTSSIDLSGHFTCDSGQRR